MSVADTVDNKCHRILQQYFGHSSFRPNQLSVIQQLIAGHDALVVMATGSGKSLCYQVPPMYLNKAAIIISPLVALIQNQVESLCQKGIPAIALTASSGATFQDERDAFEHNRYRLIYITPEGVSGKLQRIKQLYKSHGLACIAIDESHCVSEWGHDFRPDYKRLHIFRDELPKVPICALTATATQPVQAEIIQSLGLGQHSDRAQPLHRIISSFNRTNLSYELREKKSIAEDLCFHRNRDFYGEGSTIVYTLTRQNAEDIARQLSQAGFSARAYHAAMKHGDRSGVQQQWEQGHVQCIVATIAFGMGIDKPDIRHVIHYGMPDSIEAYYQQTGRAGRDGEPSRCVLFYSDGDFSKSMWRANHSHSPIQQQRIVLQTQQMKQFTYSTQCRVAYILRYFNEEITGDVCHGRCDNCKRLRMHMGSSQSSSSASSASGVRDFTDAARHIVRACAETGGRFGVGTLVDMLVGKENKKYPYLMQKSAFAALKDKHHKDWIKAVYRKLVELQFMEEVFVRPASAGYGKGAGGYKAPRVTDSGRQLMAGSCRAQWVPDRDMLKAEQATASKMKTATQSSSKWKFANVSSSSLRTNKNSNANPYASTNTNANESRKRSFSQISNVTEKDENAMQSQLQSMSDVFRFRGQRTMDNSKKRKMSDLSNAIETVTVDSRAVDQLVLSGTSASSSTSTADGNTTTTSTTTDEHATQLLEQLRTRRKKIASKLTLIPYQVLQNEGMALLAQYRPVSMEQLMHVSRQHETLIPQLFAQRYGALFMDVIRKYCTRHDLTTNLSIANENEAEHDNQTNANTKTETKTQIPKTENENANDDVAIADDINAKIIVPPQQIHDDFEYDPPRVTRQSQEILTSFQSGISIGDIVQRRGIKRATVEKCLADMVANGYKLDWVRLSFSFAQIKAAFDAISQCGVHANYDTLRQTNAALLRECSDAQIELLIARYITDNFTKPRSANHGQKWTVEDDDALWNDRDCCAIDLEQKYKRSISSIMSRLNQLKNQENKWHKRLVQFKGGAQFGRGMVICNSMHNRAESTQWSVEDDACLWHNRECCVNLLVVHFNVEHRVVQERLNDLSGVDMAARYRMLQQVNGGGNGDVDGNDENTMNANTNEGGGGDAGDGDAMMQDAMKENIKNVIGAKGASLCELQQQLNLHCETQKQTLLQHLDDLSVSFEIYSKNEKYFKL